MQDFIILSISSYCISISFFFHTIRILLDSNWVKIAIEINQLKRFICDTSFRHNLIQTIDKTSFETRLWILCVFLVIARLLYDSLREIYAINYASFRNFPSHQKLEQTRLNGRDLYSLIPTISPANMTQVPFGTIKRFDKGFISSGRIGDSRLMSLSRSKWTKWKRDDDDFLEFRTVYFSRVEIRKCFQMRCIYASYKVTFIKKLRIALRSRK